MAKNPFAQEEKASPKMTLSPFIEKSRIAYAIRSVKERKLQIYEPQQLVKESIERFGDQLCVSCSFGSCSVVVLHMALQINPKIKVVFNNTGVEYPETYAYRDLLAKEWNLNLIETKPLKSFWQCVREYGFPLIRSHAFDLNKVRERRTGHKNPSVRPECCVFLKEKPMGKAIKEYNIRGCLTGLRCAESRLRMFTIGQRGQCYDTKQYGKLFRVQPIAFWTHAQVWNYLKENDIPINEIYYKGKDRSGCMPCTGFMNWERQLAKANPKMYRYVQKLRGVQLLDNYIDFENSLLNECHPNLTENLEHG